ncbi:MAG: DMT family transporter [Verrucomicrobiota bacterium]
MDWITASLCSALFLGVYDIFKKRSVNGNAVIPVLFVSTVTSAAVWAPAMVWSRWVGEGVEESFVYVDSLAWRDHGLLFLKSLIVATSWVLSYFGLKHLPVSVASPIRATSPFWTMLGAIFLLGERPTLLQGIGICVTVAFFFLFSIAGRKEGIRFHRNRWVLLIALATLVGAASSLYDKFLLGNLGYRPATVQAWFSVYLVVALLPLMIGWWLKWWPRGTFQWRWTIPAIGLTLLLADFVYFTALADEDSLISVVSSVRRANVLVVFLAGYVLFKERNYRAKTPCLVGILLGIGLILLG